MRGNNKEPKHKVTRKDTDSGTFNSMLHAIYVLNDKTPKTCKGCKRLKPYGSDILLHCEKYDFKTEKDFACNEYKR